MGAHDTRMAFWIFGLGIAVGIFLILSYWVTVNSDDTIFLQQVHCKDIALTVNEQFVGEGESIVNYKIDSKFQVGIDKGVVSVEIKGFTQKCRYLTDSSFKIEYERKLDLLVLKKVVKVEA